MPTDSLGVWTAGHSKYKTRIIMAKESTIQHYTSSTTGNTPSAVDLASGELAINIADEKVFLKNLLGNVVSLSQSKDLSGAFASKATVVTSFNGLTGAVTGVTAGGINTFTALNTFNAGISSSGITGTLPSIMSSNSSGQLIITAKSSIAATPDNAVITLVGGDSDLFDPLLPSITLKASQINLGSASVNSSKLAFSVNGVTGPILITASTGIAIGSTGKLITVTNSGVQSFNGTTGAVGYSPAFASSSVTGVASFNSTYFTVGGNGAVTLASAYQVTGDTVAGGTGISVSRSGNTSTVTNTGVQSIDGATGAIVNIAKTDVNNNFTAGQTINGSLSSYDAGVEHQITLSPSTDKIIFLNDANGNTLDLYAGGNFNNQVISFPTSTTTLAGIGVSQTFTATNTFNALQNFTLGISASGATFSGNISAPNIVTVGTANTFTQLNTFSAGISASGATFSGPIQIPVNTTGAITIGTHATKNLTLASIDSVGEIVQVGNSTATLNIRQASGGVVSIGDYAGTLNSNYISVDDTNDQILINGAEIQLNGTISTPLVLANAESIQNTTNGRIDFMPGPTAAGAYGLYADVANWGYGVQMGTINSAGTIDSSPGGILFMDRVTFLQDKFIGFASDGSKGLITTTQGLDTLQIGVSPGAANSNAVAIVETNYAGTTNRSPVTSHTNPNLYIYRAGNTGANDFIRIEHDGTNGNIVAGGTSGIKISGLLDVASGLSAAGATFSGPIISTGYQISSGAINAQTASYSLVAGDNGKIVTMNVASANNLTVPASLAVGFNCTVIQLGAGQTTILASGTTLNSYQSYLKISGQHGSASIVSYASNVYNVAGNLSA